MNDKKIYKNPEINIVNIETASIIATSGKVQSPEPTTKPVEPKVKQSVSTKITYNLVGDNIFISIPSAVGIRKIQEKAVVVPGGDRCIVYNCLKNSAFQTLYIQSVC